MPRSGEAQRLKSLRCRDCRARFKAKPNACYCADCALRRRRASRAAWKRTKYRSDRTFRARAKAYSSLWHRAKSEWFWPVGCVDCGAIVGKCGHRTVTNARCYRCRVDRSDQFGRPMWTTEPLNSRPVRRRDRKMPLSPRQRSELLEFAMRIGPSVIAPRVDGLRRHEPQAGPPRIYIRQIGRAHV